MNLTVRCPACAALARLDGDPPPAWVQCAECQQRFETTPHTVSDTAGDGAASALPRVDAPEIDPAALSFMQEARAASFWQQSLVRAALASLTLLLALALLLQVALQERDRLAAQFPAWRPALRALCRPFDCRVALLRQIESIVIENSSFSKVAPGLYRLSFTLRNTAWVDLALPALELTLTDAQDQALVRRVLRPGELQADSAVLPASADFNGSLMLSLQLPEDTGRLASYRLLAFYP